MRDPGPPPRDYLADLRRTLSRHDHPLLRLRPLAGRRGGDEVYRHRHRISSIRCSANRGHRHQHRDPPKFANGGLGRHRQLPPVSDSVTMCARRSLAPRGRFSSGTPATLRSSISSDGVASDHVYWFLERFDQAYVDEMRAFVDAIVQQGSTPSITGADGRAAMALAYAAEASFKENRPVLPRPILHGKAAS